MKKGLIISGIIILLFVLLLAFGTKKGNQNDESDSIVHINMAEYNKKIDNKDDFVLIISQVGCSHCEEYLPIARKVAKNNNMKIYDISLTNLSKEDQITISNNYDITGTPTTIFIKNGKEKDKTNRLYGAISEEKLETKLKDLKYIK